MITKEKVIQFIKKNNNVVSRSPYGVQCRFIKLNDKWGVKVFHRKDTRDYAYDNQKAAAKYKLGPQIGQKFDLPITLSEDYDGYCYITEVAKILIKYRYDYDRWEDHKYTKLWDEITEKYKNRINTLCMKLQKKINWDFETDSHIGNVGLLNGKLVCIDFG